MRIRVLAVAAALLLSFCALLGGCKGDQQPLQGAAPVVNYYIDGDRVVSEYGDREPTSEKQPDAAPSVSTPAQTDVPLSEYTAEMVLAVMADCVNQAKQAKNFYGKQQQNVDIQLTSCSIPITSLINPIIKRFTGEHTFEYNFVDGKCADPKEDVEFATPDYAIPPCDRSFTLEPAGLVSWSAAEEGEFYVYTVKLVSEDISLDNLVPKYHAQAMDYLDYSDFGVRDLITEANSTYPGATVVVKTTKDGTLYSYEETIPMEGAGTGKLVFTLSASFAGSLYECWTFTW